MTKLGLDKLSGFSALGLYRAGHSFSPHGRTMGTTPVLRLLLRRAGYEALEQRAYAVDYSSGTDLHESNTQNHLVVAKLLQPFLVKMGVATQEELDQFHTQAEQEMQTADFCALDYFLTVWGRKPR